MPIPPSPETAARRNLSALLDFNQRQLDAAYAGAVPRPVRSLGIVGAGMMGAAIAAAAVGHGLSVVATDTQHEALASLPGRIAALLSSGDPLVAPAAMPGRIETTTDHAALGHCDLVLESVVEDAAVKRQVYAGLEPHLCAGVVLASNTSTIPVARLANGLADPGRFCGIHFFHPVRERPLMEIIPGPKTRRETVAGATAFAREVGRIPLVVKDGPGFLVNRLLMPYVSEGMQLLMEGASMEAVDRAGEEFGMAFGPLRLLDEIGLDTSLLGGLTFSAAFPETVPTSPLLVAMVKAKRLGRKSGAGFYAYTEAGADPVGVRHDPAAQAIIARWAGPSQLHSPESITARLFLTMLLEATRMLQDGSVGDPRSIDLGMILGLRFPEWRGGLLYWADTLGAGKIVEMLRPLDSLGSRVRPTPLLLEMAQGDRRFYD